MSISLVVALAGTAVAVVGLILLIRECLRQPTMSMAAWIVAAAGLTIGLAAQAVGFQRGFGATTFRAAQLGAAVVAPLALVWGMAETAARSLAGRFLARVVLAGLFVIVAVIMATDPLSAQPFSQAWPAASAHFQVIPLGLLALIAVVVVLSFVATLALVAVRARQDRAWLTAVQAVGAAGVAAVALQGLQVSHLRADSAYPALGLLAAGLTWLAGNRAARMRLGTLDGSYGGADDPGWRQQAVLADPRGSPGYSGTPGYTGDDSLDLYAGGYRSYGDTGGYPARDYAEYGSDRGYGPADRGGSGGSGPADSGGYRQGGYYRDTGGFQATGGYGDTGEFSRYGTGEFPDTMAAGVPVTGAFDALYQEDGAGRRDGYPANGYPENGRRDANGVSRIPDPGPGRAGPVFPPGADPLNTDPLGQQTAGQPGGAPAASGVDIDQLYGQIAIYTLLDNGAEEFDRLSSQVTAEVEAQEPDTLVYVVHVVPSAPLQRILYQVYRDRAAYDEHQSRGYVLDFEARRRPHVLATNVIELGVREAKVVTLSRRPGRVP